MTLEIDPQTEFAQKWDSLSAIMVPKPSVDKDTQTDSGSLPFVVISREDIHFKYGSGQLALAAKYPRGVILLPGEYVRVYVRTYIRVLFTYVLFVVWRGVCNIVTIKVTMNMF